LEERQLLKGLDHADEHVEIERQHGRDDVDRAPRADETKRIERRERHRQHDQRDGAYDVRRQQLRDREKGSR
jgi:hypothetical protein